MSTDLEAIYSWRSGDSHRIRFSTTRNGDPVDVSNHDLEWALFEKAYQTEETNEILSKSDASVEIITDPIADPENGIWEVRVGEGATSDLSGEYYHRAVDDAPGDTRQSWLGKVIIET